MESTQEIFEKIEDYLGGNLNAAELESFEKSLKTNPELQEEVLRHKELAEALKNKEVLDFRKKLIKIEDKINKKKKSSQQKRSVRDYWKIAASIALLIGASTFFWMLNQKEDLYATYYVPYPIENAKRGNEQIISEEFKIAAKNYDERKYDDAIADLIKLVINNPDNEQLKLYLGNCYLNTNQVNKAIKQFMSIDAKSRYYEDGLWYTILSYLKLEQKNKAVDLLHTLIGYNGVHKQNAIKLLDNLE